MPLIRVKARWTGFTGAPGFTVLHFNTFDAALDIEAAEACSAARAFFQNLAVDLPAPVRIQVEAEVEELDVQTGQLVGYADGGVQEVVAGQQPGPFSGVSGACVSWGTDEVRNGRRVRGRTFLVPLAQQAYDGDGTLSPATLTRLSNSVTQLLATETAFVIYARPTGPGAADGVSALVVSGRVSDKAAILRSRRD